MPEASVNITRGGIPQTFSICKCHVTCSKALKASRQYDQLYLLFNFINSDLLYLQPLPSRRRYVSATQLGGNIYVVGGYDNANRLNSVCMLDPCRSMQWKNVASMNIRRGLAGVVSYRDKVRLLIVRTGC